MSLTEARRQLRTVFGYDGFRDGQEQVIGTLLEGRSSLAVFPTGAGKSLCYQLPALLLDGLTIVVSPLIALMKDQVDALRRRGVAAARFDSTLTTREVREVFDAMRSGSLRILYLAPERLTGERLLGSLARRKVALFAIDEAHCISEWGHNFRPEYLRLAEAARRVKAERILALTATATPEVARDIARSLGIEERDVVRTGHHRANLELHATPCPVEDRLEQLISRLKTRPSGPTIVYVTLQKTSEEVARALREEGLPAVAYHAGLDDERRAKVQDRFMASDRGIVVATIAFGMGIDKADIRQIYHFNMPKSLEGYAQEIGRAGRDGELSQCEIFVSPEDLITLENFTYGDTPTRSAVTLALEDLLRREPTFDLAIQELSAAHDIRPLVLKTLLTYLEIEGVIESTAPFYADCRFQFVTPLDVIVGRFDGERASFLNGLLTGAKVGRVWRSIDTTKAAESLGEPRERVIAALNLLSEEGDLIVEMTRLRQGYRRQVAESEIPPGLVDRLMERFSGREARDIERTRAVLRFGLSPRCLTGALLSYFGEEFPGDCGHCSRCLGVPLSPLPAYSPRALGERELSALVRLKAEGHPALAEPRALARFLAGLSSPATTRAGLNRHSDFGGLADLPFRSILQFIRGDQNVETPGSSPRHS